jgi:hypothetical protein
MTYCNIIARAVVGVVTNNFFESSHCNNSRRLFEEHGVELLVTTPTMAKLKKEPYRIAIRLSVF